MLTARLYQIVKRRERYGKIISFERERGTWYAHVAWVRHWKGERAITRVKLESLEATEGDAPAKE